jgi:hypothetical protein
MMVLALLIYQQATTTLQGVLKYGNDIVYIIYICICIYIYIGAWGSVVVKALRYKSEGRGIDSRCRLSFFRGV